MSSLNSKFVKQLNKSKKSNLCTLYVKGDWNDSDYITEDTVWKVDEMSDALPYFSILVDLYAFDKDYRWKHHDYNIEIADSLSEPLEFWLDYKKGFYKELLELKNKKKVFSKALLSLDEDEFKEIYDSAITDVKENLELTCEDSLPYSDYGCIHTLVDMYIEYQCLNNFSKTVYIYSKLLYNNICNHIKVCLVYGNTRGMRSSCQEN